MVTMEKLRRKGLIVAYQALGGKTNVRESFVLQGIVIDIGFGIETLNKQSQQISTKEQHQSLVSISQSSALTSK